MTKWLSIFSVILACATATAQTGKGVTLYVAPDGNDAWSGKLASPNRRKSDGPFATLQRARDAVRELKRQQGGTLKQPVTVSVRRGTYFLAEPLVFTPEDSGGANAPVTYAAYQKEKPVISGGRKLGNWEIGEWQASMDSKDSRRARGQVVLSATVGQRGAAHAGAASQQGIPQRGRTIGRDAAISVD